MGSTILKSYLSKRRGEFNINQKPEDGFVINKFQRRIKY
tara:strand:+ start:277 stop:393 length:117 start_codon:yes stop_codon:yes gene_type:complete